MKTRLLILGTTLAFLSIACSKEENLDAFNLLSIENNATSVPRQPQFSWESPSEAMQGNISYDLYLDQNPNPTTLVASELSETTYTLAAADRLNLLTDYYWKVVARTDNGAKSESSVFGFTTRDLQGAALIGDGGYSGNYSRVHVELFKNQFWMATANEVWFSEVGNTWEMVRTFPDDSFWDYTFTSHNGKLWLIGGGITNQVWNSEDGLTWTNLSASAPSEFIERGGHSSVSFDGRLWIFGGVGTDGLTLEDAWYSSDGVNWTEAQIQSGFGRRADHASIVFNGEIWISGGISGTFGIETVALNSIYHSSDGISWESVSNVPIQNSYGQALAEYEDKLWILGGSDIVGNDLSDIWNSTDGLEWNKTPNENGSIFSSRRNLAAKSFKGSLYILGGQSGPETLTDVRIAN
ncbi:kelch repeat-containing protein [Poritiphilus flavus]|uniref:Fibronectin type-III domain-containing protein n=1 Tax=Poritiphilus flavus TaxID=2697053 RepID=A0A6L9EEK6_9FLAO|nr:kelch repeat-containing protein [Poritiphilus flavus]NAS13157.1 hypothetical protein [Poritiphilus flavus]